MANGANFAIVNGNNVWASRRMSSAIISTLLNSCSVLAALGLTSGNKMDKVMGVGTPDVGAVMSGAIIPPAMQREIGECGFYSPSIDAIFQYDVKSMGLRDTMATVSVGSGATITASITNGAITSTTITNPGTGYSGAPPTLYVQDIGGGQGAILRAVVSGGQISSVTILGGGSGYVTPVVLVNSNNSAGTKNARPTFQWTYNQGVGLIYENDMERARDLSNQNEELFNQRVNELTQAEQLHVISGQIQRMEEDVIYGLPSDVSQNAVYWDMQYGLANALQNQNVYATIDRSIDANGYWRANYDTTAHTFTLQALYNDAMLNKGLAYKGGAANMGPLNCFIVGPGLMSKFMNESMTYLLNANTDPNVQVLKREYGFQQTVIKYNDVFVITDNRLGQNTVFGINTKSFIFAFKKGQKMALSALNDQRQIYGGLEARSFQCYTKYMFMCIAPSLNIQYTAVS